MGTMTELSLWPKRAAAATVRLRSTRPGPELAQPDEITRGLFSSGRRVARIHPLATDALVAAVLLALSSVWLAGSAFAGPRAAIVQTVLIAVIAVRRIWPASVFVVTSAIALAQWLLGFPLMGDAAVLIALYTVAAHQSRARALLAAGLLEAGAVMAAVKWEPAGTPERSLIFLTATVVAALFTGLTAASGSRYLAWMDERAAGSQSAVVTCSALKRSYRDLLLGGRPQARMVFMAADRDVLTLRLAARHGHFFPRQLLGTQFDALEPPQPGEHVVTIVPADDPAATVASILAVLCPAGDRPGTCDAAGGDHEAETGPA